MNSRPLEKIDALPEEQRLKLADWLLTGTTLDEAVERVQKEFGVQIPRSTINRFRKRCEITDYLDTSEDSRSRRTD